MTVNNFVFLARDGFYDGVIFHRVINGFMIQGGDPDGHRPRRPGLQVRATSRSAGRYSRGILAMANAGPNTNGSQFFVMHADYRLPPNYTIFGRLTGGEDTLDKIATAQTGAQDRPARPGVDHQRRDRRGISRRRDAAIRARASSCSTARDAPCWRRSRPTARRASCRSRSCTRRRAVHAARRKTQIRRGSARSRARA